MLLRKYCQKELNAQFSTLLNGSSLKLLKTRSEKLKVRQFHSKPMKSVLQGYNNKSEMHYWFETYVCIPLVHLSLSVAEPDGTLRKTAKLLLKSKREEDTEMDVVSVDHTLVVDCMAWWGRSKLMISLIKISLKNF